MPQEIQEALDDHVIVIQLSEEDSKPFETLANMPNEATFWETVQALGLDPETDFEGTDLSDVDLSDVPEDVVFKGAILKK